MCAAICCRASFHCLLQGKEARQQTAAHMQAISGTPMPTQLKFNVAHVLWRRLHPNGQRGYRIQPEMTVALWHDSA